MNPTFINKATKTLFISPLLPRISHVLSFRTGHCYIFQLDSISAFSFFDASFVCWFSSSISFFASSLSKYFCHLSKRSFLSASDSSILRDGKEEKFYQNIGHKTKGDQYQFTWISFFHPTFRLLAFADRKTDRSSVGSRDQLLRHQTWWFARFLLDGADKKRFHCSLLSSTNEVGFDSHRKLQLSWLFHTWRILLANHFGIRESSLLLDQTFLARKGF